MRKHALTLCCTVCVFGAFGAFCRWLQNMTAFEADTGLYEPGNLWGRVLALLMLAAAAALGILLSGLCRRRGLASPPDFEDALGKTTVLHKPLGLVLALLMAAGAVLLALTADEAAFPVLSRILALLGLLAALGFGVMASCARTPTEPSIACFGSVLPILMGCFWLILSYRENASTSVVWRYAPEILALASSLLGFYFLAGFAFGRPKPFAAAFCGGLGAFLCITTLPDERLLAQQIMLLALAGMQLFLIWGAVANLRTREELEAGAAGEAEAGAGAGERPPAEAGDGETG